MLVAFGLLVSVAVAARADEWNKNFAVSGKPEVVVEADDGNINIRAGAVQQVSARVTTHGWRISNDDITVDARQEGNRVEVNVRKRSGSFSHMFGSYGIRIDVDLPANADVTLHTKDGNIDVAGVRGRQQIRTGDGNLHLTDLQGPVSAETGDGNIDLDCRCEALDAHTGDGNIDAAIRPGSKMSGTWTLRTGDGNIRLALPGDFAADLDAHTGDGRVRSDLPLTVSGSFGERDLRGKLNGGGASLEVRTGDGDIRLERQAATM
jgi:hypothetical protein